MLPRFSLDLHLLSSVYLLSLTFNPPQHGGKHSQSFSPFCDSISADIAAVSLDSSIRSDEDAAREIYSPAIEKERGRERDRRRWRESAESSRKIGTFGMKRRKREEARIEARNARMR